jgi:hypothetical protein
VPVLLTRLWLLLVAYGGKNREKRRRGEYRQAVREMICPPSLIDTYASLPYLDIGDAARLPATPHHHHGLAAAVLVSGRGEGDLDQLLVAAVVVGAAAASRFGIHVWGHGRGRGPWQGHALYDVVRCLIY